LGGGLSNAYQSFSNKLLEGALSGEGVTFKDLLLETVTGFAEGASGSYIGSKIEAPLNKWLNNKIKSKFFSSLLSNFVVNVPLEIGKDALNGGDFSIWKDIINAGKGAAGNATVDAFSTWKDLKQGAREAAKGALAEDQTQPQAKNPSPKVEKQEKMTTKTTPTLSESVKGGSSGKINEGGLKPTQTKGAKNSKQTNELPNQAKRKSRKPNNPFTKKQNNKGNKAEGGEKTTRYRQKYSDVSLDDFKKNYYYKCDGTGGCVDAWQWKARELSDFKDWKTDPMLKVLFYHK
jgi:hypothetical protein